MQRTALFILSSLLLMHCAGPKWLQEYDANTEVGQAAARLHKGLSRQRMLNEHDLSDMRIAERPDVFIFHVPQRVNRIDTTIFQVWKSHALVDADSALQIAHQRLTAALAPHEYDWDGVEVMRIPFAFEVSIPLLNEKQSIMQYQIPDNTWVENVTPQKDMYNSAPGNVPITRAYRMEDSGRPKIRITILEPQEIVPLPLEKPLKCIRESLQETLKYPTKALKSDVKGKLNASFNITAAGRAIDLHIFTAPATAMEADLQHAISTISCPVDLEDRARLAFNLTIEYGIIYTYLQTF